MTPKTKAVIDLALAAVDWYDTLRQCNVEQICPPTFTAAVAAFVKALQEPTEREMVLFALDRAGAPREDGVDYPPRLPPFTVDFVAAGLFKVRINKKEFHCLHTADGWSITTRQ